MININDSDSKRAKLSNCLLWEGKEQFDLFSHTPTNHKQFMSYLSKKAYLSRGRRRPASRMSNLVSAPFLITNAQDTRREHLQLQVQLSCSLMMVQITDVNTVRVWIVVVSTPINQHVEMIIRCDSQLASSTPNHTNLTHMLPKAYLGLDTRGLGPVML